jgi:acylphosphatase
MPARRIRVTGRVQGVGYRAWTVAVANRLGLKGWVRNRHDGSVEILAGGADAVLDEFTAALRIGPGAAAVTGLVSEPAADSEGRGFVQAPTA